MLLKVFGVLSVDVLHNFTLIHFKWPTLLQVDKWTSGYYGGALTVVVLVFIFRIFTLST
jgi:hypothetical protein